MQWSRIARLCLVVSLIVVFGGASKCNWLKPKIKLPDVKLTFGDPVTLSIPLKGKEITVGVRMDIPDLTGAYVELVPQVGKNDPYVFVSVPSKEFENEKFRLRDPATLPGGRSLPKIVEGKLPGVSFEVPQWNNMVFYLGLEVAGVFVPTRGKEPDVNMTIPFSDNSGRQIGFVSRIPQENGANSGYFVSFNWNMATTNPLGGYASFHERDLENVYWEGQGPIDMRDVFELPYGNE